MPVSLSNLSGAGIPGTIGGDHTAWFTGFGDDTVTSVALWDQSVSGGRVVQHSLAGLSPVPATSTVTWPTAIWKSDTSMLSVPGAG
jgi:hypothetical protein